MDHNKAQEICDQLNCLNPEIKDYRVRAKYDNNILIYSNHVYADIRRARSLIRQLDKPTIVFGEETNNYKMYHAYLFAYHNTTFASKTEAYEYGRELLQNGIRWYHHILASSLYNNNKFLRWWREPGKQIKFCENGDMDTMLGWAIQNGVSGARQYPDYKGLDLNQEIFSDHVTITLCNNLGEKHCEIMIRGTTGDLLEAIYAGYKTILEEPRVTLHFGELLKVEDGKYRVELEVE